MNKQLLFIGFLLLYSFTSRTMDGDEQYVREALKELTVHGRQISWFDAARYKQTQRVRDMLAADQDVNEQDEHGKTALHQACKRGSVELATILLNAGADHRPDPIGLTPLHMACYWRRPDLVKCFISFGGAPLDLRAEESGNQDTALHIACKHNDAASARLLLRAGARRDIKNSVGKIAREYANNEIRALFDEPVGGAAGEGRDELDGDSDKITDNADRD